MKQVFITGGTGFIGGHVVRANLAKGYKVWALALPGDPGAAKLTAAGVNVVTGDLRDVDLLCDLVKGMDVIFHCAAVVTDWAPKRLFQEVTVGGTGNICRAAHEAGNVKLVKISTNDVFGLKEGVVHDETSPLTPWNEPYSDAKIQAEEIAWNYYKTKGLPVTMVYPCWVFGEGDLTFVPSLAAAIRGGEMIFWRKDVIVWPTYIENLTDLLMHIAEDERAIGNGYLVHDGESTTLQEFCGVIAETIGLKPPRLRIPYAAGYAAAVVLEFIWKMLNKKNRPLLTTYTIKNLGSRLQFSIDKASRELGWKPPVPYREGLARTMDWLKTLDLDKIELK